LWTTPPIRTAPSVLPPGRVSSLIAAAYQTSSNSGGVAGANPDGGGPGGACRQHACSAKLAQGEDDRHDDRADAGHGDGATGKLGAS